MKKIIIIVGVLALLVGGGYYYVKQLLRDPAKLVKNLPEIARKLEFELDNVRYGHTRAGVKKWELKTRKAKRIKGEKNILLEGVSARIYAEGKLKGDTRIQAEKGSYLVDSGDIELQGAVKILNQEFQIVTEHLRYDEALEIITAPESLKVESEKLSFRADLATIDLRNQQLHLSGSVKARIRIGKRNPGTRKPLAVRVEKKISKPEAEKPQIEAAASVRATEPKKSSKLIEEEKLVTVKKRKRARVKKIRFKYRPVVTYKKHNR